MLVSDENDVGLGVVETGGKRVDGVVGLSYVSMYNSNSTLLKRLSEEKVINYPIFYIFLTTTNSKIILGEPTNSFIFDSIKKDLNYCNIINSTWGCNINSLVVGNKSLIFNNTNVLFSISSKLIEIPTKYYNDFQGLFFNETNNCLFASLQRIKCKCTSPNDFTNNINLVLNSDKNNYLEIKANNLIEYTAIAEYGCKFWIKETDSDSFILGTSGIDNVFLSFDYTNKKIGYGKIDSRFTELTDEVIYIGKIGETGFFGWVIKILIFLLIIIVGVVVIGVLIGVGKGIINYFKNKNKTSDLFTAVKLKPRSARNSRDSDNEYSGDLVSEKMPRTMIEMEHKK